MKYIIYALAVLLLLWSAWYLFRHLKRQAQGGSCHGDCAQCGGCFGPSNHAERKR